MYFLQLLPNLYHLGGASWAGANGSLSNPIQEILESMAGEVTKVVDDQLKVLMTKKCYPKMKCGKHSKEEGNRLSFPLPIMGNL